MSLSLGRRAAGSLLVAFALVAGLAPATVLAADPSPGDATIQISVGDDHAGGSYLITFERAYSNTTVDGTPVYVYVPQGSIGDSTGILGMDPDVDPNPADAFEPCLDRTADDYLVTQAQINTLGDELTNQIVRVDVEHYGPVGLADPSDPDSDALVVLAYNAFDDFYYDCSQNTYTAGYFAPDMIGQYGMNVIVTDTLDWASRVGGDDPVYEGVIAHELQHLLHHYSDTGELSWVDEGLADMAIFLNGWGDTNDSHILFHQVFHRETSLTRWGGGLENYGAAYTYFLYLWEQAGGNGGNNFDADLQYDGTGGDLLIKLIFQNQADGMTGVQNAIDEFNAAGHPGRSTPLPSAEDLYKDWAVAIWLDAEVNGTKFDIKNINFGDAITSGWTIEVANDLFFGGRGVYTGNMPASRWLHNKHVPPQTALPFGVSYETFRNPGPTFKFNFNAPATTVIAPHTGTQHWYGNYESQNNNILNVDETVTGGDTIDFWAWYFIEEGWDFGFVEALVNGDWVTIPLTNDAGTTVTTNDDPHGNNTEGNGLTGTSGGAYFVDDPVYIHLNGTLPAGATDVRFRYSTDASYLDTGFFVDDVEINNVAADLSSEPGNWFLTNGQQTNHYVIQIVSPCDLTPGVNSTGEIVDAAGFVYRFEGSSITQGGFSTACLRSTKDRIAVVISNLPTGDLTVLDTNYSFTLTNTGTKKGQ